MTRGRQRHPAVEPRPYLTPLFKGWSALKVRLLAFSWICFSIWFWAWWLNPAHIIGPWRYGLVTLGLLWTWALQFYFVLVFLRAHRSCAPDPEPGRWRVAMIVTKTPSEPFAVVCKTLRAMLDQDYPHDTWLADEDPTDEVRAWCAAHGVRISSRKGVPEYHRKEWPRRTRCKEGNLAYFYDHWGYDDYDIVVQMDADHVPEEGYLREMLRPFADPDVGYVSAPSICGANADDHWVARTRLFTEEAFHGVLQAGYTRFLAPMCIGSHYAVRTRALRQAGGLGPELAEDHSTTMLISAAGWRGVHAINAIAKGDGPASLADLVTQEFQWSRSLLTLLLRYTPSYLGRLPARLKFLFVFCQLWYALFAIVMALMYFVPIIAVVFDVRFADVTYPAFVAHVLPLGVLLLLAVRAMKADGYLRPRDAHILGWEKVLFVAMQWPWVLWGVAMAVRDRLRGGFVDFRITPKGEGRTPEMPNQLVVLYSVLALGAILPVLWQDDLTEARGFYLLALVNAVVYVAVLLVTLSHHLTDNHIPWHEVSRKLALQLASLTAIKALFVFAVLMRADMGVHALMVGLEPTHMTRTEYTVAGAGQGQPGDIRVRFAPDWSQILKLREPNQ